MTEEIHQIDLERFKQGRRKPLIVDGRAYRIVKRHYAVARRLAGDPDVGLLTALVGQRRKGNGLRDSMARLAKAIRRLDRESRGSPD